ncbi:MAG: hypothetical protein Q4D98_07215 [Planctomycetia bacterium]|nr:hypothetical protein [Planctomycetia bacterium]
MADTEKNGVIRASNKRELKRGCGCGCLMITLVALAFVVDDLFWEPYHLEAPLLEKETVEWQEMKVVYRVWTSYNAGCYREFVIRGEELQTLKKAFLPKHRTRGLRKSPDLPPMILTLKDGTQWEFGFETTGKWVWVQHATTRDSTTRFLLENDMFLQELRAICFQHELLTTKDVRFENIGFADGVPKWKIQNYQGKETLSENH